tara:strand:- start:1242 stop:2000 length:759 start_codon:yes stop_codon:yes gene_type:complete
MTLPASGTISINSLVGEYGGSGSHSLSEYYKGGSFVANHSNNANVPTSGTISLSNFHGQSNTNPTDNSVTINGSSGTRGVIFGSGVNYGWASGSYGGQAYGANGSASDTSWQLGTNSTKRMLAGAVGFSSTDMKSNTTYGIEIFLATGSGNTITSGTTAYPLSSSGGAAAVYSEISGNKLYLNGTQYVDFGNNGSSSPGNGISLVVDDGTGQMNGYGAHRLKIIQSHSSSGSTAIGSGIGSTFTGSLTLEIK